MWSVFLKPQSCTFDTHRKVSSTILHKYYDHVEFSHPVIYGPTLDWVANPRLRFIFSCWYDKDLNNVVKLKTHVGMCQGATWKSEIRSPKEQDHWLLYFKSTKPSTSIHCLLLWYNCGCIPPTICHILVWLSGNIFFAILIAIQNNMGKSSISSNALNYFRWSINIWWKSKTRLGHLLLVSLWCWGFVHVARNGLDVWEKWMVFWPPLFEFKCGYNNGLEQSQHIFQKNK